MKYTIFHVIEIFLLLLITFKIYKVMATDQEVLAIVQEEQETQAKLSADLQTVISDITAAGGTVSDDTLAKLQAVADGLKASVDSIDAAVNPPAPAAQV